MITDRPCAPAVRRAKALATATLTFDEMTVHRRLPPASVCRARHSLHSDLLLVGVSGIRVMKPGIPAGRGARTEHRGHRCRFDQAKIAEAGVFTTPDDQMVVNCNVEYCSRFRDVFGYRDVPRGRGWITRRVIVYQYEPRSPIIQSALDNLTDVNWGMIDCALLQPLVLYQRVFSIEEKYAKLFDIAIGDAGIAVVNQLVPRSDHGPFVQFRLHEAQSDFPDKFYTGDRR